MSYTTLFTNCIGFVNGRVSFPSSAYIGVNTLPNPAPLPIIIDRDSRGDFVNYAIQIGNNDGKPGTINFLLTDVPELNKFTISNFQSQIISVAIQTSTGTEGRRFVLIITFYDELASSGYPFGSYDRGDVYNIAIGQTCLSDAGTTFGSYIKFGRLDYSKLSTATAANPPNASNIIPNSNVLTNINNNIVLNNNISNQLHINKKITLNVSHCTSCTGATGSTIIPNLVRIPIINILGQTTVDGQFLSDFTFNIQDKYQYYDNTAKIDCKCDDCEAIYANPNCLKTTKFFQYGPDMQCVVKGKGKTLRDKILYTYNRNSDVLGPSFQNFYVGMITYGMLKYILAKILYGDFNVKYLCRDRNCQFFKDLARSRFCGFIEFFDDPANGISTFYRYFKNCDIDC